MNRRHHLRRLLEAYDPVDPADRAHLAAMRALLEAEGDPFDREHYRPGHFTASAFVLSPDSASVLLIFHSKLERWLQPGGHVDPHDATIADSALREVAEETSVTEPEVVGEGVLDVDVHRIPARGAAPAHEHHDVRFLMRAADVEHRARSDAQASRWVPLDSMSSVGTDESVLRAVRRIRRLSRRAR